jgi:LPS sulfotransferase NodH
MIFGGPFKDIVIDPVLRAKNRARPMPDRRYIIHFTPRSGSSWLTEVLAAARTLGRPNEWFNPSFIPNIANVVQAQTLDDYVHAVQRQGATCSLFGAEVTAHQALAVFGTYSSFHHYFADARDFWLIRKDIVLQAVSLYKMVSTGVSHRPSVSLETVQTSDIRFEYDVREIEHWVRHIWVAEIENERYFNDHGRTPVRLCYEILTRHSAMQVQNFFAKALHTEYRFKDEIRTKHDKIRTDKNEDFANRFRAECPGFVAEVAVERAGRLKLLLPLPHARRAVEPGVTQA